MILTRIVMLGGGSSDRCAVHMVIFGYLYRP